MSNLRDRARGQQGEQPNEVELRQLRRDEIARMETAFAAALPSGVEARQIVRDAMTVMQATPALYRVEKFSLLGALMTCSQLALRPGVLGMAYVLPFKGRAQFVAGYHGLKDLAHRSQQIRDVVAEPVREADEFDMSRGSKPFVHHKPLLRGDRGPVYGYYSVVSTIHGGLHVAYMTVAEVEEWRDRYALQRDRETGRIKGPWVDQFDQMASKTVLKQALKLAPRSLEMQAVQIADETVRTDLRPLNLANASVDAGGDLSWPEEGEPVDAEILPDDHPRVDPTQQDGWQG